MRHFFTASLIILALAVSAAGVAPAAHADNAQEGETCEIGVGGCAAGLVCDATGICQKESGQILGPANHTPTDAETRTENASWGFGWIMSTIMSLFAWLVGVAALTLNYAMYYTVVDMGGYVTHLSAIDTVWKILRDIGNILLIFGFLAIGISIIIDSEWYGGGSKLLPKLLIVAVFANFSLFAAEAMIDVGNLFATQIYKQINEGKILNPSDTGFSDIIQNKGIAGVLMNRLGLPSIYGGSKEVGTNGLPVFAGNSPWYMSFMSIIVFVVVAFVMFALAFILISRFIVLILLIMVSPVGVAGLAVPGLQSWASKWWDTLFHQTITAPILLLLLYIALSVIVDPGFLGFGASRTGPAWNGIETGNFISFAGILLSYLIAVGLLLAVVYFAKTLSAVGAGWATKTAGKLSFGATAFAGRRTVGRLSNYTARKIRSSSLGRSETGRLLAGVADRGAKASFDVRGTSALKNIPGGGIDAGAAQKGGYRGTEDKAIKVREDYAKSLKERKQTRSEKQQIETAEANTAYRRTLHKTAEDEHKLTEEETLKLRAEVKRLENLSIKSPEIDRSLEATRQKLATSETNLVTASTKLAEAADRLEKNKQEEASIREDIKNKTSTKGAQQAYGEALERKWIGNIPRAPYDWTTVAGSARREAAKNIIKDATKKKTKAEELVEDIEASIKKATEEKQKGEARPEEPTEKPAKKPTS